MTKVKGNKRHEKPKARAGVEKKKAQVGTIAKQLAGAKTIALIDVRALPDRLLQAARKQLRGKAVFLMAKNTVLKRALEASGKAKELLPSLDRPAVLVLTDLSAYELFQHFRKTRAAVAAKPGQVAPFDIVVHEGETALPPGPALSELKGAGINAQIKAGKIVIAKDSVVAKTGTKINDAVCKALQKLNVLPFTAGLSMVAGIEQGRMFSAQVLDIDEAKLANDLTMACADAYNMSINCAYPTQANRDVLLGQSLAQAKALASQGGVYSDMTLETLLAQGLRMQGALEGKVGQQPSS
ncbi:MAG: 50S ribosomal protein L10 [Candidatus Micrarchaeota archaeon]|nr:50S ribosomal protein L10 [Candidatus Micrarchaeota archaeon]